ncbi:MAG TPA: TRAP transporter small permease [Luteimonas sp.]|nr:TRAP transporter small permease [Luteimonas sp.]
MPVTDPTEPERDTDAVPATDPTPAPPDAPLARGCSALANLATVIAGGALLGLVAVQGWQVVARYVLNDSPSWTEPVTLLLLATAMSLGAAAGVHTRRHFGFYLLAQALRPGLRRSLEAVNCLVIAIIGAVLAGWGAVLLVDGVGIASAGAPLPQSIGYLPLSIGGALMVLFATEQLLQVASAHRAGTH